ncbi:two-component sensor histidine kinase [Streptomyces sp. CS227]|uniref:sensor histidine kinase n=1 Tax=Streptomyces sp. CS227 TaxID=1982763 RepID=UPI000B4208AA|nr:histidine kinase [Streptomyces sp. CS227]OWA16228.1 two-component sensor histidine kinase [Streptomyces sp. CS227]
MLRPPPRPHRHDVLIALAGLLGGLFLWALGLHTRITAPSVPAELADAWVLLPLAATAGAELLRRSWTGWALAVGTVALVADQFTAGSLATVIMYTDLVYAAVLYGPPARARRLPPATGLVTVAVTLALMAWFRQPQALLVGLVVGVISFAPATTGAMLRNHREAAAAARLRAEQTALLAEMDRVQAVTDERARMARELHDLVAGHLSAIAIHSTAALSLDDEATSRRALGVIRENSVAGLAEMRRLIEVLRAEDADAPSVAPTLDGLGALVEQARANGLDVRRFTPPPADPPPPAPVGLAAYRIVQEALTNALKHGAPGPVDAVLGRTDGALTVRVVSPLGAGAGPGTRVPGSGAGLVGMRERAELLGGSFSAGPVGGQLWEVRAVLPLGEAPGGPRGAVSGQVDDDPGETRER